MADDSTVLDLYLAHLGQQKNRHGHPLSKHTIRAARNDLRGFIGWWEQAKRLTFDPSLVLDRDLVDWQIHRQKLDGAKPSTINRANATLRGFFSWAKSTDRIRHNPAADLRDRPVAEVPPRGIPPEGMDWLVRMASDEEEQKTRLRDLALLTLLHDCGLRRQEATDVQLRDLDLSGGTLIVRDGKGGMPGRVILTTSAVRRLRDYLRVRVPNGMPPIGSDAEREPLLERHAVTVAGQPWQPGMSAETIRWRLGELGRAAAEKIREQAKKEPSIERVGQLLALADKLEKVTPHQLRHGLAYRLRKSGKDAAYIQSALRHSRPTTSLKYGKPTDDDVRAALEESEHAGR